MGISFINNSVEKLNELILEYEDFLKDDLVQYKANNLCTNAWHIIDWVLKEFTHIHGFNDNKLDLGKFRDSLYPRCSSLKIMHDIANTSKHNNLDRPKTTIKKSSIHRGPFSKKFSRHHDISRLEIELENGDILDFNTEISKAITFWKDYFINELEINLKK